MQNKAAEEVVALVNAMSYESQKQIETNKQDIEELFDLLYQNYNENMELNSDGWHQALLPYEEASWQQLTSNPLELKKEMYRKVVAEIESGKLTDGQGKKLIKSIAECFPDFFRENHFMENGLFTVFDSGRCSG